MFFRKNLFLISGVSIVIVLFLIIGATINYYRARRHIDTQTFTSANAVIIYVDRCDGPSHIRKYVSFVIKFIGSILKDWCFFVHRLVA
jgi:hypothetical protein